MRIRRLSAFFENVMTAQRGDVQHSLKPYLPYLSLCSDKMPDGAPPPIFYVGRESGQRSLFGEDWATPSSPASMVCARRTPTWNGRRPRATARRSTELPITAMPARRFM